MECKICHNETVTIETVNWCPVCGTVNNKSIPLIVERSQLLCDAIDGVMDIIEHE